MFRKFYFLISHFRWYIIKISQRYRRFHSSSTSTSPITFGCYLSSMYRDKNKFWIHFTLKLERQSVWCCFHFRGVILRLYYWRSEPVFWTLECNQVTYCKICQVQKWCALKWKSHIINPKFFNSEEDWGRFLLKVFYLKKKFIPQFSSFIEK